MIRAMMDRLAWALGYVPKARVDAALIDGLIRGRDEAADHFRPLLLDARGCNERMAGKLREMTGLLQLKLDDVTKLVRGLTPPPKEVMLMLPKPHKAIAKTKLALGLAELQARGPAG